MKKTSKLSITILVCSLTTVVFAGPDFDEGSKDAGSLPSTSTPIAGTTNTEVTRVRGTTSATALVGSDPVDMYLLKTGADPYALKIDMNMVSGGAPIWAARLTLFKKEVIFCGGGAAGPGSARTYARPIATVVKASSTQSYPILDGSVSLNGATGAPTGGKLGALLLPGSEYFVSVSGASELPFCTRENCDESGTETFFTNTTGIGIYGLSASVTNVSHLLSWNALGTTGGSYIMPTTGVYPVPASSCDTATSVVGSPTSKVFDFAWAPEATGIVSCAGPTWPVNRQFFYAWTPQCTGTAVVKTCGTFGGDSAIEVFEVDLCNPDYCTAATTTPLDCNDQCGTGNASTVSFTATAGREYLVRLARVSSVGGSASWSGTITFDCTGAAPSADMNGDGIVDGADLALFLGRWGTSGN